MSPSCFCFLALTLASLDKRERPEPQPLVGDTLPAGAVARLGPDAFRYAGWIETFVRGAPNLQYSRDGKRLALTTKVGAFLWDAATGKRLLWVPADGLIVTQFLGFDPDGNVIVSCRRRGDDSGGGVFRIDPATGKVKAKFQPQDNRDFIGLSPDGRIVYSRTRVNDYRDENIANQLDTGKEIWRRKMPGMSWARISPDGSRLLVWSSRAQWDAVILDTATGKAMARFDNPDGNSNPGAGSSSVAVGPKAERVFIMPSWDRGFFVLGAGTEKPIARVAGSWYDNAFLTGDGKTAVVVRGRGSRTIEVWDAIDLKIRSAADCDAGSVLALSPDGKTLASEGVRRHAGTLQFFDVSTGERLRFSPEPFTQAAVVWYLFDGTLASCDEKGEKPVKWDVKTGAMTALPAGTKPPADPKLPSSFKPPEGMRSTLASPDGKRVLGYRFDPDELDSSPGDTYLGLFDERGRLLAKYQRIDHTDGATWAFARDSKTFAIARGDGTITLLNSDNGKALRTLRHGGPVFSMSYSPDGRLLATTCGDGPILLWDVRAK